MCCGQRLLVFVIRLIEQWIHNRNWRILHTLWRMLCNIWISESFILFMVHMGCLMSSVFGPRNTIGYIQNIRVLNNSIFYRFILILLELFLNEGIKKHIYPGRNQPQRILVRNYALWLKLQAKSTIMFYTFPYWPHSFGCIGTQTSMSDGVPLIRDERRQMWG